MSVGSFMLPDVQSKLSKFNLSETLITGINTDYLYPVYSKELSPGDSFEIDISAVAKMSPLVAPFMTPLKMKFYAFWVPNTQIWKGFKEFMGEEKWKDANPDRVVPSLSFKNVLTEESIYDYFGIPIVEGVTPQQYTDAHLSALRFRAYYKIWNDWFRSPELQEPVEYSEDDTEIVDCYKLLKVGKNYDLFTSCLPTPAAVDVEIGLTGNAPVMSPKDGSFALNLTHQSPGQDFNYDIKTGDNRVLIGTPGQGRPITGPADTHLYADMENVTGVSIFALRHASAMQVLFEKEGYYGRRYFELVKAHWGVDMPEFLTGRSIFLGSVSNEVQVNPVVQNSATSDVSPQGNLAGIGTLFANGRIAEMSAVEHGQLIVLAAVQNENIYQQGIDRELFRRTRFDYPYLEFCNIGDQPIYQKELFFTGKPEEDEKVFGYSERYGELRTGTNRITGRLRSSSKNSLDVWTLAEKFENAPKLNGTFLESAVPLKRALAVLDEPAFILSVNFNVDAYRVLTQRAVPSLLAGRLTD
nr:MAG: major capsid protein [Microvirus Sku119]